MSWRLPASERVATPKLSCPIHIPSSQNSALPLPFLPSRIIQLLRLRAPKPPPLAALVSNRLPHAKLAPWGRCLVCMVQPDDHVTPLFEPHRLSNIP